MERVLLTSLLALAVAGCDTTSHEIQREQVHQRATIMELQEKQEALNVELHGTQEENARLRLQIDELRGDLEASRQTGARYQQDVDRLDELVQKLNSAREKDRQIILEEVSRELASISSRTARQAAPPRTAGRVGYEHTVARGETLYAIAKAYRVSTSDIAKANGMKVNDPLRIGQVLFIPKP